MSVRSSGSILDAFFASLDLHAASCRCGAQGLDALQQRRTMTLERLQINLFVLGLLVLPATVEDANPLESQGADGSVVFGPLLNLLLIIGARPRRPAARRGGELVKSLAQELGAGPAPMHPVRLAARHLDRGDT